MLKNSYLVRWLWLLYLLFWANGLMREAGIIGSEIDKWFWIETGILFFGKILLAVYALGETVDRSNRTLSSAKYALFASIVMSLPGDLYAMTNEVVKIFGVVLSICLAFLSLALWYLALIRSRGSN